MKLQSILTLLINAALMCTCGCLNLKSTPNTVDKDFVINYAHNKGLKTGNFLRYRGSIELSSLTDTSLERIAIPYKNVQEGDAALVYIKPFEVIFIDGKWRTCQPGRMIMHIPLN